MKLLSDLKPGDSGHVSGLLEHLPDRLLELGVLPGTRVEVIRLAPLGDPIALKVHSAQLAIRRDDAARSGYSAAHAQAGISPRSVTRRSSPTARALRR